MKLKAKPKYYNQIKTGEKLIDYRDAHITFINEETGLKCIRDVIGVRLIKRKDLPEELRNNIVLFTDETFIAFELSPEKRKK